MRFKAKLAAEQVTLLYHLVVPISRLTSSAGSGGDGSTLRFSTTGGGSGSGSGSGVIRNGFMLYLDRDNLRLSIKGSHANDTAGMTCFVELQAAGGIFMEHRIESIAHNSGILMELDIVQLRMALQSIHQEFSSNNNNNNKNKISDRLNSSSLSSPASTIMMPSYTVLKLAKRNQTPCLCLDTCGTGNNRMELHHAIPVRMSRASDMQHHLPPKLPLPSVQLELTMSDLTTMPPLKAIMDRLRSISQTVYLTAQVFASGQQQLNNHESSGAAEADADADAGQLTITTDAKACNGGAAINLVLDRLIPRMESCAPPTPRLSSRGVRVVETRVKVDTKKLAACLHWQQQPHNMVSTALLCWVENEALVLHAMLNPSNVGFFTYYIPVHFLSTEDGVGNDEGEYIGNGAG